ncbi:MAG: tyrosinase family protein [Armatimonadetes bacterium]|nr:tyrosinase family protein [Armatimonadota bacterium]
MADGLTLRKEVSTLQPAELAALRDGYQKMMAFSGGDNRSWIYWAGYHGFPNFYCWHHGRTGFGDQQTYDLFLPWHRAYLLYFEHTVRDQDPAASVPWWDWTSGQSHTSGVPAAFSDPTAADGSANPLLQGPVPPIQGDPARQTLRFPGPPDQLPTANQVTALMGLGSFVDFTSQVQDLHDAVHGWAGGTDPANQQRSGDMGNIGTSAFDPIFWSHHVMIDRIWYLWQIQNGNDSIPQAYLSKPLSPFALTVADVLDIQQLGYEYAVSSVSAAGNSNA